MNPRHWGDRPANNSPTQGTVQKYTAEDPPQTCAYRKRCRCIYVYCLCTSALQPQKKNWENIRKPKFTCVKNISKKCPVLRHDFMPHHTVLHLLNAFVTHLLPLSWPFFLLLWYNCTAVTAAFHNIFNHTVGNVLTIEMHHKSWVHFWGSEVDKIEVSGVNSPSAGVSEETPD